MAEYNLDGLLKAMYDLVNPICPCFRLAQPQDTDFPYCVLQPFGGSQGYCFGTKGLEHHNIQVTQYHDWTGVTAAALAMNVLIVAALDRKALTDDGIVIARITAPRLTILDGRVLQVAQDWQFQRYYEV